MTPTGKTDSEQSRQRSEWEQSIVEGAEHLGSVGVGHEHAHGSRISEGAGHFFHSTLHYRLRSNGDTGKILSGHSLSFVNLRRIEGI